MKMYIRANSLNIQRQNIKQLEPQPKHRLDDEVSVQTTKQLDIMNNFF